jgi:uncharacterized membrane protein
MIELISNLLEIIYSNVFHLMPNLLVEENKYVFGIDMSIESLRAKEFSEYIFVFLILSLILFCFIIYLYLPKKLSSLKTGEKIMFGALVFGVFAAIIIGYIQLIEGYLL